jgi:3-oxoacyl-(acyl-carrier-protein) synthase/acyl carrier protein
LFSSVSAIIPSLASGQIDYAMANAYMDYVAEAAGGSSPLLSIQWPSWKESGSGEVQSRPYQETGLVSLADQEGLEILDYLLAHRSSPVILPAMVDPAVWRPERLMRAKERESSVSRDTSVKLPPFSAKSDSISKPENLVGATERWLTELLARELKMDPERLDSEAPFQDYGVDSVLLAQFLGRINEKLDEPLDPSILYEYTDLASLSQRLVRTETASLPTWLAAPTESKHMAAVLPGDQADGPTFGPVPPSVPAPTNTQMERRQSASEQLRPLDIAVIGMSCRFAGADCLDSYWKLLASGRSAISRVPTARWGKPSHFYAGLIDTITRFDPKFFLLPIEDVRAMDPQALLVLEQSLELLCHAGYSVQDIKGTKTGVYLGARSGHQPTPLELDRARNPIVAVGQNYFASNISQFFDLRGPSMVVDTACSSALVAMNLAIHSLERGEIDSALVGGVGLLNDDSAHRMFEKRHLLSGEPSFHVFDRRASGIVLGEGAGFVMIKSLHRALEDGDSIYAVIKGLAVNNDGRTAGPATPNLQAHKDVMQQALQQSGKRADEIRYIEANGSGSEVTDLLELKAIESVYRPIGAEPCSLGSIKPNIGHPLCAEGIAGFIKLVLMLQKQQCVPFLSGQEAMQYYQIDASAFSFCRRLAPWMERPRLAALNCFADGGTNVHAVLEGWDGDASRTVRRQPLTPPELEPIPMRDMAVSADRVGVAANGDSGHLANPWWGTGAFSSAI